MPIPTSIDDLDPTASNNSPLGSEPPTEGDNHIRALAAIIRQEHDSLVDGSGAKFTQSGTGAVERTSQDKMRESISVKDYGAVGDGVTDDHDAIQAAVDYAESLISATVFASSGVEIYFPSGKYLLGSEVTVTKHGIGFSGPSGIGARISGNSILFNVGDYTDTDRIRHVSFSWLQFVCTNASNTTAAIKLYRTIGTRFEYSVFVGWDIGLDCYRASTTEADNCRWLASGHTGATATAAIRLQGTDETATTLETYTPGGGFHMTNCELTGDAGSNVHTTSGLLLMSFDGFYMINCHFTDYQYELHVAPDASAANHTTIDLMATNCYFDEPSTVATNPRNVFISGTVKESITMASAATQNSTYQNFRFNNCYFRGADEADNCIRVQVTDGDSWWDATNRSLKDFQFTGGSITDSTVAGVHFWGALNSPADTYVEADAVQFKGVYFDKHNGSNTVSSNGSALIANVHSILLEGNVFGPDDGTGNDYVVVIQSGDSGDDEPFASAILANNDFSQNTGWAVEPCRVSHANTDAISLQADNLYPGVGREIRQTYKTQTTNATATSLFQFTATAGQSGIIEALVVGSTSDGADTISSRLSAHFRRDGSATTLSTPVADVHDPDAAFATDPTIDLSTNTIRVRVVGIAATTIDWSARVTMLVSR